MQVGLAVWQSMLSVHSSPGEEAVFVAALAGNEVTRRRDEGQQDRRLQRN